MATRGTFQPAHGGRHLPRNAMGESGLTLALEYKGARIADGRDSREKEIIGALWAARGGGHCEFVMAKDGDWGAISAAVTRL